MMELTYDDPDPLYNSVLKAIPMSNTVSTAAAGHNNNHDGAGGLNNNGFARGGTNSSSTTVSTPASSSSSCYSRNSSADLDLEADFEDLHQQKWPPPLIYSNIVTTTSVSDSTLSNYLFFDTKPLDIRSRSWSTSSGSKQNKELGIDTKLANKHKELPSIPSPSQQHPYKKHSSKVSEIVIPPRSPGRLQKMSPEEDHKTPLSTSHIITDTTVDQVVQSFISDELSILDNFGQIQEEQHPTTTNNLTPTSSKASELSNQKNNNIYSSPASSVEHNNYLHQPKLRKSSSIAGKFKSLTQRKASSNHHANAIASPPPSSNEKSSTPLIDMKFGSEK